MGAGVLCCAFSLLLWVELRAVMIGLCRFPLAGFVCDALACLIWWMVGWLCAGFGYAALVGFCGFVLLVCVLWFILLGVMFRQFGCDLFVLLSCMLMRYGCWMRLFGGGLVACRAMRCFGCGCRLRSLVCLCIVLRRFQFLVCGVCFAVWCC